MGRGGGSGGWYSIVQASNMGGMGGGEVDGFAKVAIMGSVGSV